MLIPDILGMKEVIVTEKERGRKKGKKKREGREGGRKKKKGMEGGGRVRGKIALNEPLLCCSYCNNCHCLRLLYSILVISPAIGTVSGPFYK